MRKKAKAGALLLALLLCAGGVYGCSSKEESQIGEDGI